MILRSYYLKRGWIDKLSLCLVLLTLWGAFVVLGDDFNAVSTINEEIEGESEGEVEGEELIEEKEYLPYYQGGLTANNLSLAVNVDWGEEYIPEMLEIFEEYGVVATFFLTGAWCEKNHDLAREIVAAGHEIGNHSYSHTSPNSLTMEENLAEIVQTQEIIESITGVHTTLYAPPSGEIEAQVLEASEMSGHSLILWTADTIDWQMPEVDLIVSRVIDKSASGVIALMHPTENTVAALPEMIETLQANNYNLVSVTTNIWSE